ncbi:hypothetical protein HPP92_027940 [Vanilla planifolia]|uniref:Uncharacterized protein n=1 Tax=Vanilla planifolia TaxID=51239 RepID=A0A835PB36_VANPL|nr:hypothetical protein HPP92_027940 [Vanilla planifolia]
MAAVGLVIVFKFADKDIVVVYHQQRVKATRVVKEKEAIFLVSSIFTKIDLTKNIAMFYEVKDPKSLFVFKFWMHFGGQKATGFDLIYNSVDCAEKYEPKCRLIRVTDLLFRLALELRDLGR